MPTNPLFALAIALALAAWGCGKKGASGERSATGGPPHGAVDAAPPVQREPPPRPSETIPTPPLRTDARLHPEDLALMPENAPMLMAGRADLLDHLAQPGGWLGHHLARIPAWKPLGALLAGSPSPAQSLGLDPRRMWVATLFSFPEKDAMALETALEDHLGRPAVVESHPPARAKWPALHVGLRLVAALSHPDRARQALDALGGLANTLGWDHLRRTDSPSLPAPLASLAKGGTRVAGLSPRGWALAASIRGTHLVIDIVMPVSGPWDAKEAARLLSSGPPLPAKGAGAKPAATEDPFGRVMLLGGADLTVIIHARALGEAACWLGMGEAFNALQEALPKDHPTLLRESWRIARVPRRLANVDPRPFDRFALLLHLTEKEPQLTLTWRLTQAGTELVGSTLEPLAGRDLSKGRRFVTELLRPLEKRVPSVLPPRGPWKDDKPLAMLNDGGPFLHVIGLAELWPRLLHVRDVRRVVLGYARRTARPGRFVSRVNVERKGELLRLRLLGRPLGETRDVAPQ